MFTSRQDLIFWPSNFGDTIDINFKRACSCNYGIPRLGSSLKKNILQGVPKDLLESGEQCIVVSRFSSVFPGV